MLQDSAETLILVEQFQMPIYWYVCVPSGDAAMF